jgi:shikimate dehydrogenase
MDCQRIGGATRLVGLLGWPVAHSLSPCIHNHALRRCGLDLAYVPLAVRPRELHAALTGMRACGFVGANVTIPHKQQVMHCCDRLSDLSRRVGAVNTLYYEDGMLCGTTTDPEGFLRAVEHMGYRWGGSCVVLGNGGTARTLACALALRRLPSGLTLAGRDKGRVSALAADISAASGFPVAWTTLGSPKFAQAMAEADLCVNCTSVGMHPRVKESPLRPEHLHRGMTVFDTVYNPAETLLLAQARAAGCRAQNGLRMLLYQGLASFKLWTGVDVDEGIFDLDELQAVLADC